MKFEIFRYEEVASTNDTAIALIKDDYKKAGCVFAKKQTCGRGTKGRKWVSEEGNFFGSIFFQLKDNYPTFNEFSVINPIIISDVISHFCNKKNIKLKYPNDIFLNKKKICGILQEVITSNKIKYLIIGVGLNIVSNPKIEKSYEATNLLFETKNNPTIKEILNLIVSEYENFFVNIDSYDYKYFKNKAETIALSLE